METVERHELAAAIHDVHELGQELQQISGQLEAVYTRLTGMLSDDDLEAVERELLAFGQS